MHNQPAAYEDQNPSTYLTTHLDTRPLLLCLPSELLIHICHLLLQELKYRPKDFNHFIGTCRHVRDIALSAPELWSMIHCFWGQAWRELCIQRAGTQPLRIEFDGYRRSSIDTLHTYIPRCSEAIIEIGEEGSDTPFIKAINQIAPYMRSVDIWGSMESQSRFRLDHAFLGGQHSSLTFLKLAYTDVQLRLHLPNLRTLSLSHVTISFLNLYQLWCSAPYLEGIELNTLEDHPTKDGSSTGREAVSLPKLKYLSIHGAKNIASLLLQCLPNPKVQLNLWFHWSQDSYRWKSSTEGEDAVILSRVQSCHASGLVPVQPLTVTFTIPSAGRNSNDMDNSGQTLQFGEWRSFGFLDHKGTSSFWWQTPCVIDLKNLSNPDPIIFSISTLVIECSGHRLRMQPTHTNFLKALTGLKHLTMRDAFNSEWEAFGDGDMLDLVQWAAEYASIHPPLETLEFLHGSAQIRAYIHDLLQTGIAEKITWKLHGSIEGSVTR
jgi:hypothetical protein